MILNTVALWRFQGPWRKAALVPAGAMALVIGVAALGGLSGSNLAPIWVIFAMPVCLLWILALWLARALAWAFGR